LATFSPTDAAFEGFRITREKPQALLAWAIVYLIVSLLVGVLLISQFGPLLAEIEAMGVQSGPEPEAELATLAKLAPMYALLLPIGLAMIAVWSAAVYRVVLRPSDTGLGYMKLGADELRLALLMFIYILLSMGLIFVITFAVGLLSVFAKSAIGAAGPLLGLLIWLGAMALVVYVAVRLSLAGPQTFAEQRLRLFDSWRLTRGHFWKLFGAYVLSVILALVVVLLGMVIYAAVAAVLTGGNLEAVGRVFQPDMTSVAAYFTPAMLIYAVFGAFLGAVQNAVIYAPAAMAYRVLAAGEG
jgi:hypothetical protein